MSCSAIPPILSTAIWDSMAVTDAAPDDRDLPSSVLRRLVAQCELTSAEDRNGIG